MKRSLLFFLFLFFVPRLFFVYAQTPTPVGAAMSVEGLLIPGVNCGVANDPDPGNSKCCVPKKAAADDDFLAKLAGYAHNAPVIGSYFDAPVENYKAIESLSGKMSVCTNGGVPSTPHDLANKSCICIKNPSSSAISELSNLCKQYFPLSGSSSNGGNELQKCAQCMTQTGGFYTALGCVPLDFGTFISNYILGTGIGVAGGVALLCILYSAFRMQTSMGNAEALKKAQENLTACITGLVIIIFSVLILKIIGVDILRIPGLGN